MFTLLFKWHVRKLEDSSRSACDLALTARVLGKSRDRRALQPLVHAMFPYNKELSPACAQALVDLGHPDTVSELLSYVHGSNSNPSVAALAYGVLDALGWKPEPAEVLRRARSELGHTNDWGGDKEYIKRRSAAFNELSHRIPAEVLIHALLIDCELKECHWESELDWMRLLMELLAEEGSADALDTLRSVFRFGFYSKRANSYLRDSLRADAAKCLAVAGDNSAVPLFLAYLTEVYFLDHFLTESVVRALLSLGWVPGNTAHRVWAAVVLEKWDDLVLMGKQCVPYLVELIEPYTNSNEPPAKALECGKKIKVQEILREFGKASADALVHSVQRVVQHISKHTSKGNHDLWIPQDGVFFGAVADTGDARAIGPLLSALRNLRSSDGHIERLEIENARICNRMGSNRVSS